MADSPGSAASAASAEFDGLLAAGGAVEPHDFYRRCRVDEPIFWSEATRAWVLTRYHDVRRLLSGEEHFAVLSGQPGATIHGRTILQMRGEEHRKKNAVVARVIRNPTALNGRIRNQVRSLSAQLVAELPVAPETVDVRARYTSRLPLGVIAWLLGIADADRLRGWYRALAQAGVENLVDDPQRTAAGVTALHHFEDVIAPVIEHKRREPGNDLVSALISFEHEGTVLSDREITTLSGFLLTAGVETTDRTLASLLALLARRRDLWERLAADSAFAVALVAEMLRYEPPVQGLGRLALDDAEFHGTTVAKGQRVIGIIASANRDEAMFDAPDEFDPDRITDPHREFTSRAVALPFGAGVHHCTGSLLAKLELVTALTDLEASFARLEPLDAVDYEATGMMLRSPEVVPLRLIPRGAAIPSP